MPRTRKPSNDANDPSKIGDDDAASISLALLVGSLQSTRAAAIDLNVTRNMMGMKVFEWLN